MGWAHGRFEAIASPSEMEQVANETLYGYITHYTIGVGLAVTYLLSLGSLGRRASVTGLGALVYGVATTVASHFFVVPFHGAYGVFGRRSPEGIRSQSFKPCQPPILWQSVLRSRSHLHEYREIDRIASGSCLCVTEQRVNQFLERLCHNPGMTPGLRQSIFLRLRKR